MIVDCDIHNAPVSETALHAYLPEAWRRRRSAGLWRDLRAGGANTSRVRVAVARGRRHRVFAARFH